MLILWQARPLPIQVLFTAARQKILQVKQEQGQELGPGPGCKFITNWIPGGSQASRKCKSLFQWSLWSIFIPPTWCWPQLECRLRGHFSYDIHCHWLWNYILKCAPIKLADSTIVYSAEIGSVVFKPAIDGKSSWVVKFLNVLHVPGLWNNLLSILYLTYHSEFVVHINTTLMLFSHSFGPPLFIVTINNHNAAFLNGMTQCVTQYAQAVTTLPNDLALWHCWFAHHNTADIKSLVECNLVTGMYIDSKSVADPICKPCLAGEMHANPFTTLQNCASHPLELVHSDVHQVPY